MQIKIDTNKNVHLISENVVEAQRLLAVAYGTSTSAPATKERKYKQRAKPKIPCPICGKEVKVLKLHMRLSHSESASRNGGLLN